MKITDRIKEIWKRLGQTDIEITDENADKILVEEGNPELLKAEKEIRKPVVEKVKAKPVDFSDILPVEENEKSEEKER